MSKLDNIFIKVVSNPQICNEYSITNPERYTSIAAGLKSSNGYVVAIATLLKEVGGAYEKQKSDMAIRRKDGAVIIQENDLRSIYRKIIGILEKTK